MTLVQSKQGSVSGTTLTITLDNPTTAGNGLAVMVMTGATSTNPAVGGITLGGLADNFAKVASKGVSSPDLAIVACWLDLACAGGQTVVVITSTGGSGTKEIRASVYEFDNLLAASAFDTTAGTISTLSWSSGSTAVTAQADEVFLGICFCDGASPPAITGPSSPWANLAQQTMGTSSILSGYKVVNSIGTAAYSGTVSGATAGMAMVVALKLTAVPNADQPYPDYTASMASM